MNKTTSINVATIGQATGEIPYNMTNDYMFQAVLLKNNFVLTGLIGSLLHLDPKILDVSVINPVTPGNSPGNKLYILDVYVIVNGEMRLNLEMQIINYDNWHERSLCYLCRSFDNVAKGSDYIKVMPAMQISFIDFELFPQTPEFYSSYMMTNVKNHYVYTDKLKLSVVQLNHIELATEEDCRYEIDKWAALFKAKTWEELKAMTASNQYMESAANTIFELSTDEFVREQCRARDEYNSYVKYQQKQLAKTEQQLIDTREQLTDTREQLTDTREQLTDTREQLTDTREQLTDTREQLTDAKEQLSDKDKQLAEQAALIAQLQEELRRAKEK